MAVKMAAILNDVLSSVISHNLGRYGGDRRASWDEAAYPTIFALFETLKYPHTLRKE